MPVWIRLSAKPDSSKMRDRSREETNYATIDIENLHSNKT